MYTSQHRCHKKDGTQLRWYPSSDRRGTLRLPVSAHATLVMHWGTRLLGAHFSGLASSSVPRSCSTAPRPRYVAAFGGAFLVGPRPMLGHSVPAYVSARRSASCTCAAHHPRGSRSGCKKALLNYCSPGSDARRRPRHPGRLSGRPMLSYVYSEPSYLPARRPGLSTQFAFFIESQQVGDQRETGHVEGHKQWQSPDSGQCA